MSDSGNLDNLLTGKYANDLRIGHNLIEFIIDFGQHYEGQATVYHTRIITTPVSMSEFVATMLEALEAHRQRAQRAGLEDVKE